MTLCKQFTELCWHPRALWLLLLTKCSSISHRIAPQLKRNSKRKAECTFEFVSRGVQYFIAGGRADETAKETKVHFPIYAPWLLQPRPQIMSKENIMKLYGLTLSQCNGDCFRFNPMVLKCYLKSWKGKRQCYVLWSLHKRKAKKNRR